jgi:hypothetical protein
MYEYLYINRDEKKKLEKMNERKEERKIKNIIVTFHTKIVLIKTLLLY